MSARDFDQEKPMSMVPRLRLALGALALLGLIAICLPAAAQQPSSINPTANAVSEDKLLGQLKRVEGRGSIPDVKSYVIEQPAGRQWRQFHEVTLRWIGAVAILGMLLLLFAFWAYRGPVRIDGGRSGRTITRFNGLERFTHWLTASSFILLALSGLNISFGKRLLLPLIGADAFSNFSSVAKYVHNFLSFPFVIGLVLIFALWVRNNIPGRIDLEWFRRGGGIVSDDHPPAAEFNGGQKAVFWIVIIAGSAMTVSGFFLLFPFYGAGIGGMQTATMVHGVLAMLFVAVMLSHIYIGIPVGMEGAFEAMGSGEVDVNWAKQHHSLWLEQERARAPLGSQPRPTPAE
jgi:formate dehydrogenase subunit gamma